MTDCVTWLIVEGFGDRAFFAALLRRQGWVDAGGPGKPRPRLRGRQVSGGRFLLRHGSAELVVVPAQGTGKRMSAVERNLHATDCQPGDRVLRIRDDDTDSADEPGTPTDAPPAASDLPTEELRLTCPDPSDPRLPEKQTLERLVVAALLAVHGDRVSSVRNWLDQRPDPAGPDHKASAWTCYAGWLTDHCPGDLFRAVWDEEPVAAALEDRLKQTEVWQRLAALKP